MADRSVSVPMTLSDLERRDAMGHVLRWISLITLVYPLTLNDQIRQVNTCHVGPPPTAGEGRGVYLGVSHVSHPKRSVFQRSPLFGICLYLLLHPLSQNDQIRHGNTYGEGRVLGGQPCHCICTNASRGL